MQFDGQRHTHTGTITAGMALGTDPFTRRHHHMALYSKLRRDKTDKKTTDAAISVGLTVPPTRRARADNDENEVN